MLFIAAYLIVSAGTYLGLRLLGPLQFVMSNTRIVAFVGLCTVVALITVGYGLMSPLAAACGVASVATALIALRADALRKLDKK